MTAQEHTSRLKIGDRRRVTGALVNGSGATLVLEDGHQVPWFEPEATLWPECVRWTGLRWRRDRRRLANPGGPFAEYEGVFDTIVDAVSSRLGKGRHEA